MRRLPRRTRGSAAAATTAAAAPIEATPTAADGLPELAAWLAAPPRTAPDVAPVAPVASVAPAAPAAAAEAPAPAADLLALVALYEPPGPSAAARSALRRRPAVPFTMRRRQRSRSGPLVVASAFLAGFIGVAFAIGWLVGRMLL